MRQKGFSPVIVIIAVALIILALSAGVYYFGKGILSPSLPGGTTSNLTPVPAGQGEISNANDTLTIGRELDTTTLDSVDADLKDLESSASGL